MQNTRSVAAMAIVIAAAMAATATTHAQTRPVQPWQPPRGEPDPAKRVPAVAQPAARSGAQAKSVTQDETAESRGHGHVPHAGHATAALQAHPQRQPHPQANPYAGAEYSPLGYKEGRGGFFLGLKGGKGWVYDDVDQSAREVNLGYRWQAGPVALVGIELAGGELKETFDDGRAYESADYASIGVNARFNFGRSSPIFGLVRAGYMSADYDGYGNVDGAYAGLGLGVDIGRHFNLSLVYTNYVYFSDVYWGSVDRADTLMFGAEARF